MPKDILAVIKLKSLDSVVDDPTIHFAFHSDSAVDFTNVGAVSTACVAFLNTPGTGGTNPLNLYYSKVISRSVADSQVEIYDITGKLSLHQKHGSPVAVTTFQLTGTPNTTSLPEGVACALSYRSDYTTDVEFAPGARPRARDRNRVYLGPLSISAVSTTASGKCILGSTLITDAQAALFNLSQSHTSGSDAWVLRVWSRIGSGTPTSPNGLLKLPTVTYMDDRPDYQRRRSDPNPGARVSRALASV